MSDQSKLSLGRIITTEQHRDAVHIAVAPVTAACVLCAGEHVKLDTDGRARVGHINDCIGIVDPFLRERINIGERFWLYLYPGSITSLRHEWEHPAFEKETKADAENPKAASEAWMKAWAIRHMSEDYYGDWEDDKRPERLSDEQAYANAIRAGHNMNVGPYEDARDHIDKEWWSHWEIITGKAGQRGDYFSCAC